MGLFGKKQVGKLDVRVKYNSKYNYFMTVVIRELKVSEAINFEGKAFDVPPGKYTVVLKGLLGDPSYAGSYESGFRGAYGTFERQQVVEVGASRVTVCTFDLPGEVYPVTVQVVSGGKPAPGAEVLIREVDPNFRPTRGDEGALFYLEPGAYTVVVAHGNALAKDVIHVSEQETAFAVDISWQVAVRPSLVVVRYQDGSRLSGTTEDFVVGGSRFTVQQETGERISVDDFSGIKAIFFVKSLVGNSQYDEQKDFSIASQFGRKTVVIFNDREELRGYTLPGHTEHAWFFLFPVDPESNNAKVYVLREATKEIGYV